MVAFNVKKGHSVLADPHQAAADLAAQIGQTPSSLVLFFCSPSYDLKALGRALADHFPGPVAGCTSSGQLGPMGYVKGGLTGFSLASPELAAEPHLLRLDADLPAQIQDLAATVRDAEALSPGRSFGLLLVDGLSMAEEALTAQLYQALGEVSLVGGSAGDDLAFVATHVYHAGAFHARSALFVHVRTSLPFKTFKFHHFSPTAVKLVVTAADPAKRLVQEFDGEPAATAYGRALGLDVADLDAQVFSRHPVMLKMGGDYHIRSIQKVNADLSMGFFCAIEEGLVLTLGEGRDVLLAAKEVFGGLGNNGKAPQLIIGCDCILRRIEFEQKDLLKEMGELLTRFNVLGFSTYGEQFNSVHVNQTFTGIALGVAP